jgi:HSP20 family molecular chaperone IbpA
VLIGDAVPVPLYLEDRPSEIVLTADMPDMRREDLEITYDQHEWLSIRGSNDSVEYTAGCHVHDVDSSLAVASVTDGRLTVRLPKTKRLMRVGVL